MMTTCGVGDTCGIILHCPMASPSNPTLKPDNDSEIAGPTAVVETACPLDCPDCCSLAVTVTRGKVVNIDGSQKNPVAGGYICAKVRRFGERVYGQDRL